MERDAEFSEFGRTYLSMLNVHEELQPSEKYDRSAEIAKFFKTIVRKHRFESNYSEEAARYYEENKHRFHWPVLQ
jgi:hypothetical protein